jgi:thioesterase domain-containing protein
LATLFEARTIAALSGRIRQSREQSSGEPVSPARIAKTNGASQGQKLDQSSTVKVDLPGTLAPSRVLRGHGSGVPLFHVPGLAGFEFLPKGLANRLDKDCRFYDGLQYPEPPAQGSSPLRVEGIATHLIAQIRSIWPEGPYYLCGHSFGGVVAFEMARQLEAAGASIPLLFLLDSHNPVSQMRKYSIAETVAMIRNHMRPMTLWRRSVFLKNIAVNKTKFLMKFFVPGRRDDLRWIRPDLLDAYYLYRPAPYVGKVILFRSESWLFYSGFRYARDAMYGWSELALGGVEVVSVPGNHLSLIREPAVKEVAEKILTFIEEQQILV